MAPTQVTNCSCSKGRRKKGTVDLARVGRLFRCSRCGKQCLICRRCDRGQVYCEGDCRDIVRRANQRQAAARYQASAQGRRAHAERSRRYRARKKNVTHQGATAPPSPTKNGNNRPEATTRARGRPIAPPCLRPPRCGWCGRPLSEFVRQRFVRKLRKRPDSRLPPRCGPTGRQPP